MAADWESSEEESPPPSKAPAKAVKKPVKTKWDGEDEDDDDPVSDWEASSESEEENKPTPAAPVAPPKKKGTLKAKLAEKEALKASKQHDGNGDVEYDSDEVLDPREKAKLDKERELDADLNNAAELFGAAALGGSSSKELDSLISFQPRTKEDFQALSHNIIEFIIKRHENKPLYASFVEHHVRELAMPLKDVEVRKAASGLTTLANEKQKEQRDKASGKKKPKTAAKPAAKMSTKLDTSAYVESLDDFGDDDFM